MQVWIPLTGAATDSAVAMAADSRGNWINVPTSLEGGHAVVERQTLSWIWSSSNLANAALFPATTLAGAVRHCAITLSVASQLGAT